jgi:malonate-semialdehyde dehydrogenase (acetylating) / methylmalonate-semialdehyde dehydrogenase
VVLSTWSGISPSFPRRPVLLVTFRQQEPVRSLSHVGWRPGRGTGRLATSGTVRQQESWGDAAVNQASDARGAEKRAIEHCTHWIGGKPWAGEASHRGDIYNPATGQVTGTVDFASAAEVGAAVEAAASAWPGWAAASLTRRASVLFAFREQLRARQAELAALVSAEHGKVASDAAGEVARGLEVVEFACGLPHLLKGGFSENVSTGIDAYSIRQPLGVVAGITPFNFPAMVPMWMFPIAIGCGNAFVLKPSEKDPSASLLLAEMLAEAGLPDGVFNVVHGAKEAVDALLTHPVVKAVSFVGSTPIARYIYETGTSAGKRVQALGGAKNHMVVLPDADLDLAADAAVSAGFGSAGERCMAISVVVAVDPIGDELVEKIASRVPALRVGPGDDERSEMGPLVTRPHRDKVASYLDSGVGEGAVLAVDGRQHPLTGEAGDGFWLGPSVLDHVTPSMACYRDEIFGPVLSVVRAPGYDEAMQIVSQNPYGNGTAIFTNDGGAARRFTHEVEVGMVGINVPIPVPMAFYSFGGWKASLFGDTHIYGTDGVHFYTRGKAVTSRWLDPSHGGVNLGFPVNR